MLLLSGDVLLLFNPVQINYSGNGAAAISFKEDVATGKNIYIPKNKLKELIKEREQEDENA